jgi:hypothetical protein
MRQVGALGSPPPGFVAPQNELNFGAMHGAEVN